MYTKAQVDKMLLQVEQEFEKTLESIAKNEKNEVVVEESAEANAEEFETIDDLYASMTKSEIEAHYSSLKKVMMAKAEEKEEEKEEEKKESKEHEEEEEEEEKKKKKEEKEEMEKCGEMSAKKAETDEGRANEPLNPFRAKAKEEAGEDDSPHAIEQKAKAKQKEAAEKEHGFKKVNKSEQSLIEENQELKKNLENLNELVSKLFSMKKAPEQKAITAANFIAKSEEVETEGFDVAEMSKNEVTSKLKALDFQSLSKSDRDAINNFYLKNGSVDKIKHLISK